MSKKTSCAEMWNYGDWLKTFLSSKVKARTLQDLAKEAIRLLNINYTLTENDISLHYIKEIEKEYPDSKNIFENWKRSNWNRDITTSPPMKKKFAENYIAHVDDHEKGESMYESFYLTPSAEIIINNIYNFRENIIFLFKNTLTYKFPWQKALAELIIDGLGSHIAQFLLQGYNDFSENFIIADNELVIANRFIYEASEFVSKEGKTNYNVFKWDTVIARIFFNFLIHGGQNYYGFCERCDAFYIVQRRGRKKYCSDSCRSLTRLERIRQ